MLSGERGRRGVSGRAKQELAGEPGPETPREGQELAQGHTASQGRSCQAEPDWARPLCLEGP